MRQAVAGLLALFVALAAQCPRAHADTVAYLFNVLVRPGYGFGNADEALAYGNLLCGQVAQSRGYAEIIAEAKADLNTSDDYQASYLISQAVNELCPQHIWQLRNSAAHYRPTGGPT